ncbi:hypothetical protein RM844_08730 [Streptomyces sp. DSM 44915]|uniref:Secreted protein n=1 Tax=Streptomyces chisholmiae TaxID=3075540 RepID=A0ABU2JNT4_9ACTN|nr:hypothetical protein [Streptomyces sp. DSM 44915]MDT0266379.1 hypothetical protein [Streptomyces sp. DSM 44915]
MDDDARLLLIAVSATALLALVLGGVLHGRLAARARRRQQRFFGLPDNSECLLVVSRDATAEGMVARNDVLGLMELAAVVRNCGAVPQLTSGENAKQGFGDRTEFCLGGPVANRRSAAHLAGLLPGVRVRTETEGPDRWAFEIGEESYRLDAGVTEYVLLARLMAGDRERPVFLACGQRSVTHQAATRYLARNYPKLARKHGSTGTFCLLLKVVNSQAYGADVVELVADVSKAATVEPSGFTTSKEL